MKKYYRNHNNELAGEIIVCFLASDSHCEDYLFAILVNFAVNPE